MIVLNTNAKTNPTHINYCTNNAMFRFSLIRITLIIKFHHFHPIS